MSIEEKSNEGQFSRSLNPMSSSDGVVAAGMLSGVKAAAITAIPTAGISYYLHKTSAFFRKSTSVSSRTALLVMPPLFVFALRSELEIISLKRKEARAIMFENSATDSEKNKKTHNPEAATPERVQELTDEYLQNFGSPARIKPQMQVYHHFSNIIAGHPFKILGLVAVPTVAYIGFNQATNQHKDALKLSQKIMHTRVYGQFGTLLLLGVFMSWKISHDTYGDFISVEDAEWELSESAKQGRRFKEKIEREWVKKNVKENAIKQRLKMEANANANANATHTPHEKTSRTS